MNTRHPRRAIKGIIELARDHSAEPERLLDDRQRTDELSSRRPPWSSTIPRTRKTPAAPPENEPDALPNVKFAGEAGRIADSAGINGYDGIWHPADKLDGADAAGADLADDGGDNPGDNASDGASTRPATEAAEARPTDTEPSTSAETTPAEH
ncbi:hypothetical protein [Senegalimassilia anaerobia]|uniref:Uncharacterized protein n=1 Tax=Senegalimassilia anaerobia TaxID=1473216 RepID=A0A369L746_9ACTN|nr:hypothetical protein [Senegalimassilia anaerobia]RDB55054.1 hypothetical protein C1880_07435 [Senegalimassilia anaerobia]